jgi:uncharacterized protein (DUF433 family)
VARTVTLSLSDEQVARLERFAHDHNSDLTETVTRLIDEALRQADHPDIEFRDSPVGRQAYVRGSTLAVWEIAMLARERKNEIEATAAYLGWPLARVQAALSYAAAYPEEIATALRENDSFDEAALQRLLPQARVINMALVDSP